MKIPFLEIRSGSEAVRPLFLLLCLSAFLSSSIVADPGKRPITLDDVLAFNEVSEARISPDGTRVAYTVWSVDAGIDEWVADIWLASWDGSENRRVTTSPLSESTPRWSADGKSLGFLSARHDDVDHLPQIWILPMEGGEARRVSSFPGGVEDFSFSPDGTHLAVIALDVDPDESSKDHLPSPPIVVRRFQFRVDGEGYLGERRRHLYLLDLTTGESTILTPGDHDEYYPVWSPDGKWIAFITKRGEDPDRHDDWDLHVIEARTGAESRVLTKDGIADCHPDYESAPSWSPDGKKIAVLRTDYASKVYYARTDVALVDVETGAMEPLTGDTDQWTYQPQWSSDGKYVYFLLEGDRVMQLARVPAKNGKIEIVAGGPRTILQFDVAAADRAVVLSSTTTEPYEVHAVERRGLRPLSRQNDELVGRLDLAQMEEISFPSDEGIEIHGFVMKPRGWDGESPVPSIVRVHGGPVYQFSHEFMLDWQLFAANGFAVIAPNPRGSSGRGERFAMEIWADWGNKDARDVLAAADYAVANGIADPERLGIGGWSYGGMLTDSTIASDSRFAAAISGAGIANIFAGYGHDMYVREYEKELGKPWESVDEWIRVSFPFLESDKIVTPTLFICGELDVNVPLIGSEQMYQALRSRDIPTELVIYPDTYHSIETPSYYRDRFERYLEWYSKYLKK